LVHIVARTGPRTLRCLFQNVICHAGIGAGDAIEDVIERNFRAIRIAVLAGVDSLLGLAQSRGINQDDASLFWWRIEEIKKLWVHRSIPDDSFSCFGL